MRCNYKDHTDSCTKSLEARAANGDPNYIEIKKGQSRRSKNRNRGNYSKFSQIKTHKKLHLKSVQSGLFNHK